MRCKGKLGTLPSAGTRYLEYGFGFQILSILVLNLYGGCRYLPSLLYSIDTRVIFTASDYLVELRDLGRLSSRTNKLHSGNDTVSSTSFWIRIPGTGTFTAMPKTKN